MASHFLPRIANRIRFLVSAVIQREVADPRLGLVTVLKVEPTADLREARVYISIFGKPGDRSKTLGALEDARAYIQKQVARNLETRVTPRLTFVMDESIDKVSRIESLVEPDKERQEDAMAKKSGKKDERVSKGGSGKPQKSGEKPAKAVKGTGDQPGRPAKDARGGKAAPEGSDKQLKAGKSGKTGGGRKPFHRDDFDGERGPEKEFEVEGIDDEEKSFVDEFEPSEGDDEESDDDDEDEEEEEEDSDDDEH
ncbi:MAG: 30S ribosome-binding factor RbfA [Thermoanaerobaculia bacterium]